MPQHTKHFEVASILGDAGMGFVFAMFCFAMAFFGTGAIGFIAVSALGIFVFMTLAYFSQSHWIVSAVAKAVGTAPYVLLLELDQTPAGRLLVPLVLMGPIFIGTYVGFMIRSRRRAHGSFSVI